MPSRTPDEGEVRLCWRHDLRLLLAAFGSLLDLKGNLYLRATHKILADARQCARCQRKNGLTR